MPKIQTSQGTVYIKKKGKRSNKLPLISCHGGPGGTHLSIEPMLELSTNRQVIVYDQIGSGQSSKINKTQMTINYFCKNLKDIIDYFKFKKVVLHGSSWGGTLILEFYKRYPEYVEGLIFHSSMLDEKLWRKDAESLIKKLPIKDQEIIKKCEDVGATDSKVYLESMERYYRKHVLRVPRDKPKSRSKSNREIYQYMWGPSEFCATGTLKDYSGLNSLKKINIPTLFICGEYDESMPRTNKFFSKQVSKSKLSIIKNASHSSLSEQKTLTLTEINNFLDHFNI